jgi:hypothetical protein
MFRRRNNKVEVELVGGLGNQLFLYFAGLYYAIRFKKNLIIDISQIPLGMTNHGSEIISFRLNQDSKLKRSSTFFVSIMAKRILNRISIKHKKIRFLRLRFTGVYQSSQVGFDEFINNNSILRLQGYYQTWYYFDELKKLGYGNNLELQTPSIWFIELQKEMKLKKSVAIHVRRGDYKNKKSPTGLLSVGYYVEAIEKVSKLSPDLTFWIFSDEIDDARQLLSNYLPEDTNWVVEPKKSDPAESLVLMSMADVVITANSSFSWWAAKLGNRKELVIYPKPWFKNTDTPLHLIPDSWQEVNSTWE